MRKFGKWAACLLAAMLLLLLPVHALALSGQGEPATGSVRAHRGGDDDTDTARGGQPEEQAAEGDLDALQLPEVPLAALLEESVQPAQAGASTQAGVTAQTHRKLEKTAGWSLANLLLLLASGVGMGVMANRFAFGASRHSRGQDGYSGVRMWDIAGIPLFVGALALFMFTQHVAGRPALLDGWTFAFALLAGLQALFYLVARKARPQKAEN